MKTIKDIFENNGIAAIFENAFAMDFALFFADTTAALTDKFILFKYGEKTVYDKITTENAADIVTAIIGLKIHVWRKMLAALTAQYSAAAINETRTKGGTLTRIGATTDTDTAAKKAFNDTEFDSDTENVRSAETEQTDTYNLTETVNRTPSNVTENISKELVLRQRNNLQFAIIDSIIKEITINIY